MLLQQTAKYLLKSVDISKKFQDVKMEFRSCDWTNAIKALEYVVNKQICEIKGRIEEMTSNGVPYKTIFNVKEQVNLIRVS